MNEQLKRELKETLKETKKFLFVDFKWTEKIIEGKTIYIPMPTKPKISGYTFGNLLFKYFERRTEDYLLITSYKFVKWPLYIVSFNKYSNLLMKVGKTEKIFEDILIPYETIYNVVNFELTDELLNSIGFTGELPYDFNNIGRKCISSNQIMRGLFKAGYGKGHKWKHYETYIKLRLENLDNIIDGYPYLIQEMDGYGKVISSHGHIEEKWKNAITASLITNMTEQQFFENTIFYEEDSLDINEYFEKSFSHTGPYKILYAGTKVQIIRKDSAVSFGTKKSGIFIETELKVTTAMQAIITPCIKEFCSVELKTVDVNSEYLIDSSLKALRTLKSKGINVLSF